MLLPREPGAHLAACATAFPPHEVDQETTIEGLARLFPSESPAFLRGLVRRSGVETRRFAPSVPEILTPVDFTERNRRYAREAHALAARVLRAALERARIDPERVDVLIDVSCTGLTIPALDVGLAQELGLRPDVRRIPVTEAGCAAGALGLGLGATLCAGGAVVLLVAVELCSLTLCAEDRSRANVISAAIFADGAGAAVLVPGGDGPRVRATGSHLVPGSRDAMGFDVGTHGLRILLRPELPDLVRRDLAEVLDGFLARHGRSRADVGLHLLHPGGRRILEAYEEVLGLGERELAYSRASLRTRGNLSSVSVLHLLEQALDDGFPLAPGRDALLLGVGPGLSLELSLLTVDGDA
jgi:alkylresorcinol/alkylpyrone synthase